MPKNTANTVNVAKITSDIDVLMHLAENADLDTCVEIANNSLTEESDYIKDILAIRWNFAEFTPSAEDTSKVEALFSSLIEKGLSGFVLDFLARNSNQAIRLNIIDSVDTFTYTLKYLVQLEDTVLQTAVSTRTPNLDQELVNMLENRGFNCSEAIRFFDLDDELVSVF